jgi:beta-phosphoglucomutase-like phosphatase (HAD superfamily)
MRINALIFDVDGTLADTEEAHRAAFNRAFEQHQPPRWPVAACRRSRDTTNVGA